MGKVELSLNFLIDLPSQIFYVGNLVSLFYSYYLVITYNLKGNLLRLETKSMQCCQFQQDVKPVIAGGLCVCFIPIPSGILGILRRIPIPALTRLINALLPGHDTSPTPYIKFAPRTRHRKNRREVSIHQKLFALETSSQIFIVLRTCSWKKRACVSLEYCFGEGLLRSVL